MKTRFVLMITVCAIAVVGALVWIGVSPRRAVAGIQSYNFNIDGVPAGWKHTGGVSIDTGKNHGEGSGGSLKLAPGAVAVLNVAKVDSVGKIEFWVFDDGTKPEDPKAYRDGPTWGIQAAAGAVEVVGPIYASYLSGDTTYAVGMSPDGGGLYRDVIYLGINRNPGWHKWTFLFDNIKGLTLFYDDKDINTDRQLVNQDNIKTSGFVSVRIAGDTGAGNAQTLWVDDVTVDVTGELKTKANMESKVMPTIPLPAGGYYAGWKNGPSKDPKWFPIGVWLQDPKRAAEFKAIGFNFYIGLWEGPTEEQLAALKHAGMPVMCDQNAVGLQHINDPNIIAWMQNDEPDNAQPDGKGGYGPPVLAEEIVARYNKLKAADPTRPVFLNLGQGVAWDNWYGRGTRTNKPEDYPGYVKGADILSFDIYPVVTPDGEVSGKLWKVPYGVDRLVTWTEGKKPVWNAIECTRISNPNAKPTPAQVKTEIWMSIIHGSRGLVYFVHQFQEAGGFIEAALLADKEMSEAVGNINKQITELAPVLNTPNIGDGATIASSNKDVPVDVMVKKHGGNTYLFAVAMRNGETTAEFVVKGLKGKMSADVVGENRQVAVTNGKFTDDFKDFGVHIYKVGK